MKNILRYLRSPAHPHLRRFADPRPHPFDRLSSPLCHWILPFFRPLNRVFLNRQIFDVRHLICYRSRHRVGLPSTLLYRIEKSFQRGQENRKRLTS